MYYRSGTGGTLLHSCQAYAWFSFTRWQHSSVWYDVMAAVLKVLRKIDNLTLWIDAYLIEEHFCQISSRSNLKWRGLRLSREMMSWPSWKCDVISKIRLLSIDVYLLEEQSCQISSWLKWWSLTLFKEVTPTRRRTRLVSIRNQFLI